MCERYYGVVTVWEGRTKKEKWNGPAREGEKDVQSWRTECADATKRIAQDCFTHARQCLTQLRAWGNAKKIYWNLLWNFVSVSGFSSGCVGWSTYNYIVHNAQMLRVMSICKEKQNRNFWNKKEMIKLTECVVQRDHSANKSKDEVWETERRCYTVRKEKREKVEETREWQTWTKMDIKMSKADEQSVPTQRSKSLKIATHLRGKERNIMLDWEVWMRDPISNVRRNMLTYEYSVGLPCRPTSERCHSLMSG